MTDYMRLVRELRAPPIPKLILYALATRADADGICWPSIRTLCDDTGLARRTIQMHLQKLMHDQLLVRAARAGRPSVLRLNILAAPGTICTSARNAPVDNEASESARAAPPPRAACTGGAHDVPITSAGGAPEVTKKFPLNFPLKLRRGGGIANQNPAPDPQPRWWTTEAGIRRKGAELCIAPRVGESYPDYKKRLFAVERDWQREVDEARRTGKTATG